MREKPIVMPVLFGDEQKSVARKIPTAAPSMPAGTIVWVEIDNRWLKARVNRIEVRRSASCCGLNPLMTGNGLSRLREVSWPRTQGVTNVLL